MNQEFRIQDSGFRSALRESARKNLRLIRARQALAFPKS
jgi:hypothetical protein